MILTVINRTLVTLNALPLDSGTVEAGPFDDSALQFSLAFRAAPVPKSILKILQHSEEAGSPHSCPLLSLTVDSI